MDNEETEYVYMETQDWQNIINELYNKTLNSQGLTAPEVANKITELYTVYSETDDLSNAEDGIYLIIKPEIDDTQNDYVEEE